MQRTANNCKRHKPVWINNINNITDMASWGPFLILNWRKELGIITINDIDLIF